jgi:alginate O-acetyltransferase complex protein AlgI
MIFSSTIFLFAFLPVVLTVYFAMARAGLGVPARNGLLLAASLFFYAWGETGYVVVLLLSIAANHGFGLWIERARTAAARRRAVGLAIATNLLLLGAFKYANFLVDLLNIGLSPVGVSVSLAPIHLPIGISFFTFQAITYVVDIYRREAPVERNPFQVALYISLFPQLIAGPIVRYSEIASQLRERSATLADVAAGVRRFTVGLGKKVLIANSLAVPADRIFALPPNEIAAPVAWLGAVCFGLQIYFDFSGYTDMAIGLGRMFGFRFPENFRYPYASRSIREFWRRWHITLATWFRDYVYIPLGGSHESAMRTYRNLLLVFVLCGLWHGASLTFLVWGLLHGALMVVERLGLGARLERAPAWVAHAYTLLAVTLAWVVFRADDLPHALAYGSALFIPGVDAAGRHALSLFLDAKIGCVVILAAVFSTPLFSKSRLEALRERVGGDPSAPWAAARFVFLNGVVIACAMALASGTHNPFIYFRF